MSHEAIDDVVQSNNVRHIAAGGIAGLSSVLIDPIGFIINHADLNISAQGGENGIQTAYSRVANAVYNYTDDLDFDTQFYRQVGFGLGFGAAGYVLAASFIANPLLGAGLLAIPALTGAYAGVQAAYTYLKGFATEPQGNFFKALKYGFYTGSDAIGRGINNLLYNGNNRGMGEQPWENFSRDNAGDMNRSFTSITGSAIGYVTGAVVSTVTAPVSIAVGAAHAVKSIYSTFFKKKAH